MPGPYSSQYSLIVADQAGNRFGELTNAVITSLATELNGWGNVAFSLPTTDPKARLCNVGQLEVQLWRDPLDGTRPKCLSWGPIIRRRATPLTVDLQAAQNPLWYLSKLTFGPVLNEFLTNGDFEAGLTGWADGGTVVSSADTAMMRKGTTSLKLVSTDQGLDNYESQQFVITAGAQPVAVFTGAEFYLTASSATPYIGPAFMARGLYIRTIEGGIQQAERWQPIDNSAPRNQWCRIYGVPISVPAGHTQTVEVRYYSPGTEIHWDMGTCRVDESTGGNAVIPDTPVDVATIVANVLAYAQDVTKNKPPLNLTGPTPGSFGVAVNRQYHFSDNGFIWPTCFQELIDDGICDVDVVWDPFNPTTRTVTLYAHKGSTKPELTLEVGANIGDFSYDEDALACGAAVTVIGQGQSSETVVGTVQPMCEYVGYAADTAANGGITLQVVESAVPESPPDGIASKATTDLARLKEPPVVASVTTKENLVGALIGEIEVGDSVWFVVDCLDERTLRRVVGLDLDPVHETLTVLGN
jgi:hypothetical protein